MPNRAISPIAFLLQVPLWVWTGATVVLDYLGRATVIGDLTKPDTVSTQIIAWILNTPSWMPGALATLVTAVWLWAMVRHFRSEPSMLSPPTLTPVPPPAEPILASQSPQTAEGSFPRWPDEYRPASIVSQKFIAQEVLLDGYSYANCEFINVTFVYNGTTAVQLTGCRIFNPTMSSRNPAVAGTVVMLQGLGVLQNMTLDLKGSNAVEAATWEAENPNR